LDNVFPDKLREMKGKHTNMMRNIEELEDFNHNVTFFPFSENLRKSEKLN